MAYHITAEALFCCITEGITAHDNRLAKFTELLHDLYDTSTDAIELFRILNHTRIQLLHRPPAIADHIDRLLKIAIGYIDTELDLLARYGNRNTPHETRFRWTGNLVELVEVIYALDELHCINDGELSINELFMFFGRSFGMDMKESYCYNAYADMKRRKNDSRTYFLDKMRERLNLRMQRDDEKERMRK